MGEIKKKSISHAGKSQGPPEKKQEKPKEVPASLRDQNLVLAPKMDEAEIIKVLTPLKAITVYSAAPALGVNASIASALLKSLEGKGVIKKVGGYSGHYVWTVLNASSKTT